MTRTDTVSEGVELLVRQHDAMADVMMLRRLSSSPGQREMAERAIAVWREVEAFLATHRSETVERASPDAGRIEAVARAIHDARWSSGPDYVPFERYHASGQEYCRRLARAALGTAMQGEGVREALTALREKVAFHFRLYEGDARGDAFSIVLSEIDAALREPTHG